ncbi:MAG: hypothetical protein LBQ88_02590 [Treponema sp.]|jgi:hypothetical protein|nr:hypothetical protein [Treponema sp.]
MVLCGFIVLFSLTIAAAVFAANYFVRQKSIPLPPFIKAKLVTQFNLQPGECIENIIVSEDGSIASVAVREIAGLLKTKVIYHVYQEGKKLGPFDVYQSQNGAWAACCPADPDAETPVVPAEAVDSAADIPEPSAPVKTIPAPKKELYTGTVQFHTRPGCVTSDSWYYSINKIREHKLALSGRIDTENSIGRGGESGSSGSSPRSIYIISKESIREICDYTSNPVSGELLTAQRRNGRVYVGTGREELGPFDGAGFLSWSPNGKVCAFTAYLNKKCYVYKNGARKGPYQSVSFLGWTACGLHFMYIADYSIYVDDENILIDEGQARSIKFAPSLNKYAYHLEIKDEDARYDHYIVTSSGKRYGPFSGPPLYTYAPISEYLFIFAGEYTGGAYQPVAFFNGERIELSSLMSYDIKPVFSNDGRSFSIIDMYKYKIWKGGISRLLALPAHPVICYYAGNSLTYLIKKADGYYFISGAHEYGPYDYISAPSKDPRLEARLRFEAFFKGAVYTMEVSPAHGRLRLPV